MQGKTEPDVLKFVGERYDDATAKKLANIGRGGDNNKKGADFENFYAAAKICMLAASAKAKRNDFKVSCQETAFVDDVCVRNLASTAKVNYQAKNSDGAAASWDAEMQVRFEMQQEIDLLLHGAKEACQVLLVSDADKAAANDAKIPDSMKSYCLSEHFPHCTSSLRLVDSYRPLREALASLCGNNRLASVDTAFRVVLGEWCADNLSGRIVGDVIARAKAVSKPDIFAGVEYEATSAAAGDFVSPGMSREVPQWLAGLLQAFQFEPATVESGAFVVRRNGMIAMISLDTEEPEASVIAALQSPGDIFNFLMSLRAVQLAEHLSTGDDQQ